MSFAATRTSRHASGGRAAAGCSLPFPPSREKHMPNPADTGPARNASGPKEGREQMTDQPALAAAAAGPGQAGLPVAGATARPAASIRPAGRDRSGTTMSAAPASPGVLCWIATKEKADDQGDLRHEHVVDGSVTAAGVRPEEPMGDGGQQLHEWAFGADERGREGLAESASTVPASIAGRRTYDLSVPWWGPDGPGGEARTPTFIVSHGTPAQVPKGSVYTFAGSPIEALELAAAAASDKDVDVFSASI